MNKTRSLAIIVSLRPSYCTHLPNFGKIEQFTAELLMIQHFARAPCNEPIVLRGTWSDNSPNFANHRRSWISPMLIRFETRWIQMPLGQM